MLRCRRLRNLFGRFLKGCSPKFVRKIRCFGDTPSLAMSHHAARVSPPVLGGRKERHMSTDPAQQFDPIKYKETTREQWQTAAEPWHRWGPTLEEWLG